MNRYKYSMELSVIGQPVLCRHCKLEIGVYTNIHGRTNNAYSQCPRCGWDQRTDKYKPCECNSDHCTQIRYRIREQEENADPNGYVSL